ncbi:MAG: DUF2961 domain-containing protein [Planctomycetes bacterium]|nr:DUF2961 domain-containing protein [Planctomycetota bacterium]
MRRRMSPRAIASVCFLAAGTIAASDAIDTKRLLEEMVDLEGLARRPEPSFKQAMASSYSRKSHERGEAWFDNTDVGQYVRTEMKDGRKEHVLADLKGPGAITRFWSANPRERNIARFYFDSEARPRIEAPLRDLFDGKLRPFGPAFSYVSGTGGNLYYPLPYAKSLEITVEEGERPLRLYYEIGHRTYRPGTEVRTFDPAEADAWRDVQARVAEALLHPAPAPAPDGARILTHRWTIPPGESRSLPVERGEEAVYEWSVRVPETRESREWQDPRRAHNAYRFLLLEIRFDGERSIETPLGDFFGSAPGVNPYENVFFTVGEDGRMTSRLLMPFRESMELRLTNAGRIPYPVELALRIGAHAFTDRGYHLRAQWGSLARETWPPFDTTFLDTTGEGKVVGSTYQIANPVLIWWGEGDQKISIDGEAFPSTFGTGTEDDYGYAYGHNRPFVRPYHAQTRVDGPASGGHISLNRWYVLDALPYAKSVRFDQEMWHWMPCRPTWTHVVYWYAKPGAPGPGAIDRSALAPVDLGIREDMLDPLEGESLRREATGGTAATQRLANCSRAEHLFWHGADPGDRLKVFFSVPEAGRYSVELNLCMAPDYGRQRLFVNGKAAEGIFDGYSPKLRWMQPKLGVFDLRAGENVLEVEALEPNPAAVPKNLFGLDYIFLISRFISH